MFDQFIGFSLSGWFEIGKEEEYNAEKSSGLKGEWDGLLVFRKGPFGKDGFWI